jgi:hypothetical protein
MLTICALWKSLKENGRPEISVVPIQQLAMCV